MCSALAVHFSKKELIGFLSGLSEISSRQLILPTESVYGAIADGTNSIRDFQWGFRLPNSNQLILHARHDSIGRVWSSKLRNSRCIVLATHFYLYREETAAAKSQKIPYEFSLDRQELFCIAGFYEQNTMTQKMQAAVITIPAVPTVLEYHDRMPAILTEAEAIKWLKPDENPARLAEDLTSFHGDIRVGAANQELFRRRRSAGKHRPSDGTMDLGI